MTARAVGAFLVAMVAIGYLLGSFEDEFDLLLAVLASVAFAVLVEVWLRRGERRAALEPGDFDVRATKRAVRRGVVRTALTAVVWVALTAFVLEVVSSIWQTRGDREQHFANVVRYGFVAARPGFEAFGPASCCNTGLRTLEAGLTVDPRTASPLEQSVMLWFELDLRGRLGHAVFSGLPLTGVDAALESEPRPGALDALPEGVVATAVVELRRPLDVVAFHRLLARGGLGRLDSREVAVYLEPSLNERPSPRNLGDWFDERVSWPNPAVAGFQAWVKTLRASDDEVLDRLGLLPVSELRRMAETPRIHGFVLDQATPARLRAFEADLAVEGVWVGDVAFNLSAGGP